MKIIVSKVPEIINKQVGKYLILNEISRGGMGIIYLGKHVTLNRYAAVKMLFPHLAGELNFVKRFMEEMNAMSKLKHPNIVDIYDYEEAFKTYFIVMEVVVGRSLESLMKDSGPIQAEPAGMIIRQVLKALDCAHSNGILHRDIKPSNIMITTQGFVKVLDFGIAKIIGGENLTQTGFMVGTPQYISPEQAQGEPVVQASDLYSVSVVLFQLLTGQPPFVSNTPVGVIMAHIKETPPKLRKLNPNIPAALEKFVLKGLEKKPQKRFASAQEMLSALDEILPSSASATLETPETITKKAVMQFEPTKLLESVPGDSSKASPQDTLQHHRFNLKQAIFSIINSLQTIILINTQKLIAIAIIVLIAIGIGWLSISDTGHTLIKDSYISVMSLVSPAPAPTAVPAEPSVFAIPQSETTESGTILGIAFIQIPEGSFTMGEKAGVSDLLDNSPDHQTTLDTYYISKYEITNEQYNMFIQDTGYPSPSSWSNGSFESTTNHQPVTNVTWYDANTYCIWFEKKTGLSKFRLPTEAEWERAASGSGIFPWGNKWNGKNSNVLESGKNTIVNVGSFPGDQSASGLYDLGGNVREWIWDYYSMSAYAIARSNNPEGPEQGERRVIRGGSYRLTYKDSRVKKRDCLEPYEKADDLGFRLVYIPV